jgi:DnaK suppressor protein
MLTKEKIAAYKAKLVEDRKKLIAEIEKDEKPEDFGDDIDNLDEEADEAEELGNNLSAAAALKVRVSDIDSALNKIEQGEYGICESCKTEISEEVLDVAPESRLCSACKQSGQK